MSKLPLLFIDVDGVISTYGFAGNHQDPRADGSVGLEGPTVPTQDSGQFHMVDGIVHHIGSGMDRRISTLIDHFEGVWATGWGERANEHLVHILGLPRELEVVEFAVAPSTDGSGHWKLDALSARAGDRAIAWIDDGLNDACVDWAQSRSAPTLLVSTDPYVGLTDDHVDELIAWPASLACA